jgi:hypothetical protein
LSLVSARYTPQTVTQSVGDSGAVTLALTPEKSLGEVRQSVDDDADTQRFAFSAALTDTTSAVVARGFSMNAQLGLAETLGPSLAGFASDSAFASPYLALLATPESAILGHRLPYGVELRFGGGNDSASGRQAMVAELAKSFEDGSRVTLQYGSLREDSGLLTSLGSGALALGGATTRFLGASLGYPLAAGVRLLGSYNTGWTDLSGSSGLLHDITGLRSSSYSVGLAFDNALTAGDVFGLAVSQPLRVDAGSATLDVPVARTIDGQVVRTSQRIGLSSGASELDAEATYRLSLGDNGDKGTLGFNLMLQMNPGNDPQASPAGVAAVRYSLRY